MMDILFTAGQALSVIGLAHGWFPSSTYCADAEDTRGVREMTTLLHYVAIA